MLTRSAVLALAAFSLAACATLNSVTHVFDPAPNPKAQIPALEQRIYALVEKEREKVNPKATPLTLDPELTAVARAHSQDMVTEHYFGHRSPTGKTSATIIMARDANFHGLLGENLAAQYYTPDHAIDVDAYAKRFVESWIKSKSHRDNLAFTGYEHTGVGVAMSGREIFVTQLFSADTGGKAAAAPKGAGHRTVSTFSDPDTAKSSDPPPGRHVQLRGSLGMGMLRGEMLGDGPGQ